MKWLNISLVLLLVLPGCFTDEEPIQPLEPHSTELSMYRPLNGQVYYSLKERKVLKQNGVNDWDMAFNCAPGKYDILLNTARGMGSYNTQSKDFNGQYSEEDYPWTFDKCNGQEDQSCLGEWGDFDFENPQSFGDVYLVSLGIDLSGLPSGIVKLRVNGYSDNKYHILIGDLDDRYEREYIIEKNDSFNFVYLSFEKNKVLNLEPPKNDWDLLFTSYTTPKRGPKSPPLSLSVTKDHELVDGVLMNPYRREISVDTTSSFEDINFFDVEGYQYSDHTNVIGRRWYAWNPEKLEFRITRFNTFILRDDDKNFYALDFTDFRKIQTTRSSTRFIFKSL